MPKTTQIAFRIPDDMLAGLKSLARSEDRTVSNLLNRIIRLYLTSSDDVPPTGQRPAAGESERC